MSRPVVLANLADAIADRLMGPYLMTAGQSGPPHTTAINLRWEGGVLVGPCGRSSGRNATARSEVSVLWPPNEPGGYSLIVDADAVVREPSEDGSGLIELAPTHAIWHRPAEVPDPTRDCAHDCKPV